MGEELCHYNGTKYVVVGILHSCSAGASFIACLMVIGLIILFKKLGFFYQRLIFYLSVVAALYSVVAATVKTDYVKINQKTDTFCEWIAFASQYTQWSFLLAICVITFDILFRMIRNEPVTHRYWEIAYLIVIFIGPGTFNWIPFRWDLYGISGDWCWIKSMTYKNGTCQENTIGMTLQFALWYGPLFIACCIILLSYALIVYLLRKQQRQLSIYNPDRIQELRNMRNEIYSILWYPVVFMIINLFPLTNRLAFVIAHRQVFVLWVLHAVISPLQGGFMALVYALDPETRRKLNPSSLRAAAYSLFWYRDDHPVVEYRVVIGEERGDFNEHSGLLVQSQKSDSYGTK